MGATGQAMFPTQQRHRASRERPAVGFDGAIKSMKIEIWSLDSRPYEKNVRKILQNNQQDV